MRISDYIAHYKICLDKSTFYFLNISVKTQFILIILVLKILKKFDTYRGLFMEIPTTP